MVLVKGPQIGLPEGVKEQGQRVDFRDKQFDLLVETKGVRLAWARACICPCTPVNAQTKQPDPNCTLCNSTGFIWFRPADYEEPVAVGTLTDLQQSIVDSNEAVVIRGVVQGVDRTQEAYDVLGDWIFGSFKISVRSGNRIGYYDRLIAIDVHVGYSQIVYTNQTDPTLPLTLRYPATCVNFLRSEDARYEQGTHYTLDPNSGVINWIPGQNPPADTKLAVQYLHNPHMLMIEHPHNFRQSLVTGKPIANQTKISPQGNPQPLPIQGMARLEFLLF